MICAYHLVVHYSPLTPHSKSAVLTFVSRSDLLKCLAATQGPKVRVNAILPGLLLTEWVSDLNEISNFQADFCKGGQFHP